MIKKITSFLFILIFFVLSSIYAVDQVNIQGTIYAVDSLAHMKVGPGSMYTALNLRAGKKELKVYFLAVDRNNPYVRFNSLVGRDSTVMGERISQNAIRHSKPGEIYFGGTNGDFYETSGAYVGRTINGSLISGEIVRNPHASRPMVVIDKLNEMFIDRMQFSGKVIHHSSSYAIANINDMRGTDQLILYNSYIGNYTHTNPYGTEVLVQLAGNDSWGVNKTMKAKVIQVVSDKGNMRLAKGQAVLSGHGTSQDFLKKMQIGDEVQLQLNYACVTNKAIPDILGGVGGDRIILQNGNVTDNDWAELHPRTALGYNREKIIFCVVDGRSAYSAGVTTKQLGDVVKTAGATDAINLDGGGSSGLYIRQYGMMNRCSDGSERAVANGIFAVATAPEDNRVREILPQKRKYALPPYGVIMPTILGYNQYGLLVDTDVKAVFSCDPSLGYINSAGAFVASGNTGGKLNVRFGESTTSIEIEKIASAPIAIRLDSVIADGYKPYEIEVMGRIGEEEIGVYPAALTWKVENPAICKVENGVLTGLENGNTRLFAQLGEFQDTLLVKVQIPDAGKLDAITLNDLNDWEITASPSLKNFTPRPGDNHNLFLDYQFSMGRYSNILLKNPTPLYGLPDSVRLVFDPANGSFSKIILALKANNETTARTFVFENPASDKESTLAISVKQFSDDAEEIDRNIYPVTLGYIQFYLATTGNVSEQRYSPQIKEFSVIYKGVELGMTASWMQSGLKVYPNPVENGELTIDIPMEKTQQYRLTFIRQDGTVLLKKTITSGCTRIPITGIASGIYFVQVANEKLNETVKVIIK